MGFAARHEDAGLLAHMAIEAIHDVRLAGGEVAVNALEVGGLRGPGGIFHEVHVQALLDGLVEIEPELAFGWCHAGESRQTRSLLKLKQCGAMGMRREVVEHGDTASALLQRKVAHVADEENELLLVVRPAKRFRGRLDDDDPSLGGGLFGQGTDEVSETVVGNVDPAALLEVF